MSLEVYEMALLRDKMHLFQDNIHIRIHNHSTQIHYILQVLNVYLPYQ